MGDLPSYKSIRKTTKKLAKYEVVAKNIDIILNESFTDKLSFSEIKKDINNSVNFNVTTRMWKNARKLIASNDSNWIEKGYSYIRK